MKILIYIFLFFSMQPYNVFALTDIQTEMPKNTGFMKYYLNRYAAWYAKEIHDFSPQMTSDERSTFHELLSSQDTWMTTDLPKAKQVVVFTKEFFLNGTSSFRTRLYIPRFLRSKMNPPASIFHKNDLRFVTWKSNPRQKCWGYVTSSKNINFPILNKNKLASVIVHLCSGEKKETLVDVDEVRAPLTHRFPFIFFVDSQYTTYDSLGPREIFYALKDSNMGLMPPEYFSYIFANGTDGMLSFDKISQKRDGQYVIFYP
jgi:hypothetical protein